MKISIFGLGYVGTVIGCCLSKFGNDITFIDINSEKVKLVKAGRTPILEKDVEKLLLDGIEQNRISATDDSASGLDGAEYALICVGTPTDKLTGKSDLRALTQVANDISNYLLTSNGKLKIAICSTVPPGTTENLFRSILISNKVSLDKFTLAFIPEFLREGSAVADFLNPTRYVVGTQDPIEAIDFLDLRSDLKNIFYPIQIASAEMLKTVENAWHATKISFANEISRLCDGFNLNATEIMNILVKDSKLNVSAAYMRPGFSYGGSCIPKDLRSLNLLASEMGVVAPLMRSLSESNEHHIHYATEIIKNSNPKKVTILGLSFKAGTDDLRESPTIRLIQELRESEIEIKVHDFIFNPEFVLGENKFIWNSNLYLKEMFESDLQCSLVQSDLVVVAQYNLKYESLLKELENKVKILNLVNL